MKQSVQVILSSPVTTSAFSPVHFRAEAHSTKDITGWDIYVNNINKFRNSVTGMDTSLNLPPGVYSVEVKAWDASGDHSSKQFVLTVEKPPAAAPVLPAIVVASPKDGATISNEVTFTAASVTAAKIVEWAVYADDAMIYYTKVGGPLLHTTGLLPSGQTNITITAWDENGNKSSKSLTVTLVLP
jgi:hypothetical protein